MDGHRLCPDQLDELTCKQPRCLITPWPPGCMGVPAGSGGGGQGFTKGGAAALSLGSVSAPYLSGHGGPE